MATPNKDEFLNLLEAHLRKALRPILESLAALKGSNAEIKLGVSAMKYDLHSLKREVSELGDKVGSLIVDTSDLKDEVKALGDKIDADTQINKRRIEKIREELGLSSS